MTLLQTIQAIEAAARMQPSVAMIVPNDVFRLNATPDARYGVFAWTQRQHAGDVDGDFHRFAFSLFYVDRLTADKANEVEIQSVGIQTIEAVLRELRDQGIFPVDGYTFDTFNQRFEDECAGVWCSVTFEVPVSPLCVNPDPVPPVVRKTVADLIAEGWAEVVTGNSGDYVEIRPGCPYAFGEVVDLAEVATDAKQLTEGRRNAVVWDRQLPEGWTQEQVSGIYAGKSLPFTPRGRMLWALRNVARMEVTFAAGRWNVNDYPWGSGRADGIFAPRYNSAREEEYEALGFLETPTEIVAAFAGEYTSVAQCMFTRLNTTRKLTIRCGGEFSVQDAVGMFESNDTLRELVIEGPFRWDAWRLFHNAFMNCRELIAVPHSPTWARDAAQNTIYPRYDGGRGSADAVGLFATCAKLKSIGPTVNMNAVSLAGCVAEGYEQAPLTGYMFNAPELEDVRLINVGNGSWNFAHVDTKTYLPKMDAASIDYLLEHVKDATGQGWTLTFASIHAGEVSAAAIASAEAKGWTVIFANS